MEDLPILCTICSKRIPCQEVMLCADCKIGVRIEYQKIKEQAASQRRIEQAQSNKWKNYSYE